MLRSVTNGLLVLVAIVVAGVPLAGMHWALHQHAATLATTTLTNIARRGLDHAEMVLTEAADAIAAVAPRMHDSCDARLRGALATAAGETSYLRHLMVVGQDGAVHCASSDLPPRAYAQVHFRPSRHRGLSLGIANDGSERTILGLRMDDGPRAVIAMLAPDVHRHDNLPLEWRGTALSVLSLDDGTVAAMVPAGGAHDTRSDLSGKLIQAVVASDSHPLTMKVSVLDATIGAGLASIRLFVNVAGGGMALAFLLLVVHVARRPRSIEEALKEGIRRDEFVPYYQPVFDVRDGSLLGCEVLIRWRRRDGTIVPPGAFIQTAEESGLAVDMTRLLMRKVRDEAGVHYAARPTLKLAFNLFADHFSDMAIIDEVRETFANGGIRFSQLVFEVTERYPLPNLNRARSCIAGLQDLGCRIALDDAGTGHGGLAYLQTLGMDQIKIDKLFIDTIDGTSASAPIVDSLIDLARGLGMEIVAEGVETTAQLRYLKARGVPCAQGYLFAPPLPGVDYFKLVDALAPVAASQVESKPRRRAA